MPYRNVRGAADGSASRVPRADVVPRGSTLTASTGLLAAFCFIPQVLSHYEIVDSSP